VLPNILITFIKKDDVIGHVTCMGEMRNTRKILIRKSVEKGVLGISGWEDDIKMGLEEK
jgi:hypothetical protein